MRVAAEKSPKIKVALCPTECKNSESEDMCLIKILKINLNLKI